MSKEAKSPAIAAYPAFASSVQTSDAGPDVCDVKVRVCGHCDGLNTRSLAAGGPGLPGCRLFLDICGVDEDGLPLPVVTPPALAAVANDFTLKKQLSLVDIKFMTPSRKDKAYSYSYLRGDVSKARNEFSGVLGLMIGSDHGDLSPGQQTALKTAITFLCDRNHLFGGLRTSLEGGGYSFPVVDGSHCDFSLSSNVHNSQQVRVGSEREGVFVPVDDMPSFSHQVPLDQVPVGSQTTRGELETTSEVTYGDLELEAKIFPCEYPFGRGHFHPSMYKSDKANTMKPSHYVHARLRSPNPMWRSNRAWNNFQFDWFEKRNIHEAQAVMVRVGDPTHSGKPLTAHEAHLAFTSGSSDLKRCFVPSSVSGSAAYMKKKFLDLCTFVNTHGMPDIFLTLTANEKEWADVLARCDGRSPCSIPVEVAEQMDHRFRALMGEINKGNVFGKIKGRFVKLEYQDRGALHYHILLWLEDTTDKCKHVSAVIPPENVRVGGKTPREHDFKEGVYRELRARVLKHNIHTHNGHCLEYYGSEQLKKKMTAVRDGLSNAQRDLERGVVDVHRKIKIEKFIAHKLLELEELTEEYEQVKADEALRDQEPVDGKSKGGLPRGVRCKQGYPFVESASCYLDPKTDRWVYVRRHNPGSIFDDCDVIEYNPRVSLLWDGGHNCRLCSDSFTLEYLLKYVSKMEPTFDLTLLQSLPEKVKEYLNTEEGKHIYGRIASSVEVGARLLSQHHVSLSATVTYLPTDIPSNRTRVVDQKKAKALAVVVAARTPSTVITADADVGHSGPAPATLVRRVVNLAAASHRASHREAFARLFSPRTSGVGQSIDVTTRVVGDNSANDSLDVDAERTELGVTTDEIEDIFCDGQVETYMQRPDALERVLYPEYFKWYAVGKCPKGIRANDQYIDRRGKTVYRLKKEALIRWHCKVPHIDNEVKTRSV